MDYDEPANGSLSCGLFCKSVEMDSRVCIALAKPNREPENLSFRSHPIERNGNLLDDLDIEPFQGCDSPRMIR